MDLSFKKIGDKPIKNGISEELTETRLDKEYLEEDIIILEKIVFGISIITLISWLLLLASVRIYLPILSLFMGMIGAYVVGGLFYFYNK